MNDSNLCNTIMGKVSLEIKSRHSSNVDGNKVNGIMIDVYSGRTYNATFGGYRQSFTVGVFGKRVTFRELKAGGFNYDKIADRIMTMVNTRIADIDASAARQLKAEDARANTAMLCEKYNVGQYGAITSGSFGSTFTATSLTNKELGILVKAAQDAGISL